MTILTEIRNTPLTAEQHAAAEANYDLYKGLLDTTVRGFVNKYGGNYEDLRQDAETIFVQSHTYGPGEGMTMQGHIRSCVWMRLIDQHRTTIRRGKRHVDFDAAISCSVEDTSEDRVRGLMADLTEDAKTLLRLFTDTPTELREIVNDGRVSKNKCAAVRLAFQKYLRDKGWDIRRVFESFESLKEVVNE